MKTIFVAIIICSYIQTKTTLQQRCSEEFSAENQFTQTFESLFELNNNCKNKFCEIFKNETNKR